MTQEPVEDLHNEALEPEVQEAEARKLGWSGREKWRGSEEDFIDAPEFLRRAKEHLPLVNAQLSKERARVSELERRQREYDASVQDLQRRLKAQAATHEKMMDLQKAELLERFESEKRNALAIEDPTRRAAAYDAANRRERDAIRNLAATEQPALPVQEAPQQFQVNQDVAARAQAWVARETWLNDPLVMAAAGSFPVPIDLASDPEGHLDYIKAEMEKRFPGLTGSPAKTNGSAAPQRSAVEGASTRSGGRSTKVKGWGELPSEAKTAAERMITSKMIKSDPAAFRKSYAENYWKEYGE